MAFAADSDLHSILDSGRNLHTDRLASAGEPCTVAGAAWIADYLALAIALRTGADTHSSAEQGVDHMLHLTAAVALWTGLDVGAVPGPLALTVRTWTAALDSDLLLHSAGYFLKSQGYASTDVPAAIYPLLGDLSAAEYTEVQAAEPAAETTVEDAVENVVEVAESLAEIRSCSAIPPRESELVVS